MVAAGLCERQDGPGSTEGSAAPPASLTCPSEPRATHIRKRNMRRPPPSSPYHSQEPLCALTLARPQALSAGILEHLRMRSLQSVMCFSS